MCKDWDDRETVDDTLINFDDIVRDVLTDSYHQLLPSSITLISKNPTDHKDKKRKREDDDKEMVQNSGSIEEWKLKTNENYSQVFAGKHIYKKPLIGDRSLCSRFHIKGYCFTNCKNTATHIPSRNLEQSVRQKFTNYVQCCRSTE